MKHIPVASLLSLILFGANGILISREYDEMRVENLNAIGQTLAELGQA